MNKRESEKIIPCLQLITVSDSFHFEAQAQAATIDEAKEAIAYLIEKFLMLRNSIEKK